MFEAVIRCVGGTSRNGYHQLSMTDYITVVCEKALLSLIDFLKALMALKRTGILGQTQNTETH